MGSRKHRKSSRARKRSAPRRPSMPLIATIGDRIAYARAVAQMAVMALSSEPAPMLQSCATALNEFCVYTLIAASSELDRLRDEVPI